MNISTKQLQAFVYAAQLGSFTRAAERLHMTQAGLSATIRELEVQVDCRLFNRTTRVISLTDAGQRLLPVAERAVTDLQIALAEIGEIEAKARDTLRLGATPLVANDLLPPVYAEFRRSRPNVALKIFGISPEVIVQWVANGELDVGLGVFPKPITGIERSRLFSSRLFCVTADAPRPGVAARRGNPLRRIGAMTWDELAGKPLIGLPPDNAMQQLIERHLPQGGAGVTERSMVNHIETQVAMAEIGLGWAIIPSFALPACRHYRISIFELTSPGVDIDFYRIVRKGRRMTVPQDEFCKLLAASVEQLARR